MVIENKKSNIDVLNVKKDFIIKGDINTIIEQLQEKKEKYDHKYLVQTHNSSLERRMNEG